LTTGAPKKLTASENEEVYFYCAVLAVLWFISFYSTVALVVPVSGTVSGAG